MKVTKITGSERCSTHLLHQLHQLQGHIVKRISCLPPGLNELDESVNRCCMTCRGVGQRRCEISKRRHLVEIVLEAGRRKVEKKIIDEGDLDEQTKDSIGLRLLFTWRFPYCGGTRLRSTESPSVNVL